MQGQRDPEFRCAEDVEKHELVPPLRQGTPAPLPPWRWQFGIASILGLTTIVAMTAAIIPPQHWPMLAIGIAILLALWVVALVLAGFVLCIVVYGLYGVASLIHASRNANSENISES